MPSHYRKAAEEFDQACEEHDLSDDDLGTLAVIFLTESDNAEAFRDWLGRAEAAGVAEMLDRPHHKE